MSNPNSGESDYFYVQSGNVRKIKSRGKMGGWIQKEDGMWEWKEGYGKFVKKNDGHYLWVHLGIQR